MARVRFNIAALPAHEIHNTADRAPFGGAGCGWFDSSRELASGLEVREGLPQDAGLNEWISACLLG